MGAGGAARAISVECALAGAKQITIANTTKEKGEELVNLINQRTQAEAVFVFWDKPFIVLMILIFLSMLLLLAFILMLMKARMLNIILLKAIW